MKFYFTFMLSISTLFIFSQKRKLPTDTTVVTTHDTTIKGISFSYTATTGTQPVWNSKDEPPFLHLLRKE